LRAGERVADDAALLFVLIKRLLKE